MKEITRENARALFEEVTNCERTIIIKKIDEKTISIIATLEEHDGDTVCYLYDNRRGWEVVLNEFISQRDGNTLIEKIADECGYHCGGIYIEEKEPIDVYLDLATQYYISTDTGIRKFIRSAVPGVYCFIINDDWI